MSLANWGRDVTVPITENLSVVVSHKDGEFVFHFPSEPAADFSLQRDVVENLDADLPDQTTLIQASAVVAFRNFGANKWPESFK